MDKETKQYKKTSKILEKIWEDLESEEKKFNSKELFEMKFLNVFPDED